MDVMAPELEAEQPPLPEELALAPMGEEEPAVEEQEYSASGMGTDTDAELVRLVERLTAPEKSIRETKIRFWKELHEYWRTNQYLVWDEGLQDFRNPEELALLDPSLDIDPALFAKQVNIYRAHGESIIAALTTSVPSVKFTPEDAEEIDDVMTAKARSKLAVKVQNDNKAALLMMKAMFHLFNEGIVFGYTEHKTSAAYGMDQIDEFQPVPHTTRNTYCPSCAFDLGAETDPQSEPMPIECPQCGYQGLPEFEDSVEETPEFVGLKDVPKSQEAIEVYGGLHVQVPSYLPSLGGLANTPYLRLDDEIHIEQLRDIYPEFEEKIQVGAGADEQYERAARQDSSYFDDWTGELCTYSRIWLRPWTFNALSRTPSEDEMVQKLKTAYPDGVYLVICNGLLLEAVPDKLEDHWVATEHPLALHIHADPLGKPLKPIQDITNELVNLGLENIEFGISETFVDTDTLNFKAYNKSESRPGMVYPVKRRSGEALSQSFFETSKSTLSQEYGPFAQKMEQMGQFVVGSSPSIWGGALEGGSGTAREYELSRAQALQRLTITWTVVKYWWADMMRISTGNYVKNLRGDVKFAQKVGDSYINVWIRTTELQGRVGKVEPEVNEAFPISWAQKRDTVLNLIQLKDPQIGEILMHPENRGLVRDLLGFEELYIPGDDARNKQLAEIVLLLQSEPIDSGQLDPMSMEPVLIPSIPIDQQVDDHETEYETGLAWLKSEVGLAMKNGLNPGGWMNVRAHTLMHGQMVQMAQMQQAAAETEDAEPGA